jgi:Putative Na+/H+ antiporter
MELKPEVVASICFAGAVVHTFVCPVFAKFAHRFQAGSLGENVFHYLAEVEVVFGIWAFGFLGFLSSKDGLDSAVSYLDGVNFTEAAFVFVIMAMASTKPIMAVCTDVVNKISDWAPKNHRASVYFLLSIIVAPMLGALITEPAAMVVAALLLKPLIFDQKRTIFIRYSTLAVLLVNISIAGTLTHFAAPPVIMVASKWHWDLRFMFQNFGWKSAVVVVVNGVGLFLINSKELKKCALPSANTKTKIPFWMFVSHALFMTLVVRYHGSMAFFIPLFLLFLGWTDVSKAHQDPLKLRESLLVGFFLGGLVTLGQAQQWWIAPLIGSLDPLPLFLGATGLTAFTDNAALTFLGTLVPHLSDVSKYLLVAGAVAGGGLTVIANAPNPIAVGLLKGGFADDSINPWRLILAAIIPTTLACLGFWFL